MPENPFEGNTKEVAKLISSPTPQSVPLYEKILSDIDLDPLRQLSWFWWLSGLCRRLVEGAQGLEDLASLAHITITRAAVSMLVRNIVMPNLPCLIPYPCADLQSSSFCSLTKQQKLSIIDLAVRVLLVLLENAHTRSAVLKHFGELLAALLALNSAHSRTSHDNKHSQFSQTTNPSSVNSATVVKNTLSGSSSDTAGPYPKLPNNYPVQKNDYKEAIIALLDQVHQSTVFTHLMILHSAKGDGGRMSRIVRKILDTMLQKEDGIAGLLSATILPDASTTSALSTQNVDKICNLLIDKRPDSFLQAVIPQVMKLLKGEDKRGHQFCASFIVMLEEKHTALWETQVIRTLLDPLESSSWEGQIDETVISLKAWVEAAPPDGIPLPRFLPLLCLLYSSIASTNIALKSTLKDTLFSCFDHLQYPCPFIMSFLFPSYPGVTYSLTSSSCVVSIKSSNNVPLESISWTVIKLINEKKLNKIKIDIYQTLLKNIINQNTQLDIKLCVTKLLVELSSDPFILDSLSNHPQYLIDFLINVFSNKSSDIELINFGLILLTVFLDDKSFYKKQNWTAISKLEAPLKDLSQSSKVEIEKLANEVLNRLNYLGIIKLYCNNSPLSNENEEVVDCSSEGSVGRIVESDYDIAYRQATDALLPVRAHALKKLAKLLQANDKSTTDNRITLLHLFKMNLDDEDSYLYLSAVEGLSCLASMFPDEIITTLCQEFISKEGKSEFRLKIGQVIMKTVDTLGESGAKYKKELLGALMVGMRDQDPLVKASSLSNIGQVAKVLSFQIDDCLKQVLDSVEFVLDSEEELEVRRAAVLVISLLLQGLGNRTLQLLEGVLPILFRRLRELYLKDEDSITRLHAQVALEHLSTNLRSLVFSEPELFKLVSNIDINQT